MSHNWFIPVLLWFSLIKVGVSDPDSERLEGHNKGQMKLFLKSFLEGWRLLLNLNVGVQESVCNVLS